MTKQRRPYTWSDIYHRHIRAGDDQSYAAWAADRWEQRQRRKTVKGKK